MSRKTNNQSGKASFWTTVPGILTAIAAVITAIGGLVAALSAAGLLGAGTARPPSSVSNPAPVSVTTPLAQTFASSSPSGAPAISAGCFQQYFQGMARDRISSLESGTDGLQLIGADQTKDDPMGILFTDNTQPIGGIRLRFISNGQLFKVDSVVDSNCHPIQAYVNITRGGDKNVLQNFDSLQMRLGNADYELRLEYDGSITAGFRKDSP